MRNEYSIMDKIYLMFCLLFSKFINVKVRLIRLPVDIRGKKYIDWGKNLTTGRYCRFEAFPSLVKSFCHLAIMCR